MKAKYICEKFTQDSDPIRDLKIGNMFVYLKSGDIIKSKKISYLSRVDKHNIHKFLLKFLEPKEYVYRLRPGFYSLIMDVKVKKDKLYMIGIPFYDIQSCKSLYEDIIKGFYKTWDRNYDWWYKTTLIETWTKYFQIVE